MTAMRMGGDGSLGVKGVSGERPAWSGGAGAPPIRMLHIGKTGGSVIRDLIARDAARHGHERVVVMPHKWTISDLAEQFTDAPLAFFLRDPVERAVSGFLSRQRKGRPRLNIEWRPDEAVAFSRFASPDALGRGLAAKDAEAFAAARAIRHVGRGLKHYLCSSETLRRLAHRIVFVGAQESLDADMKVFGRLAGLDSDLTLSDDPVTRHESPDRAGFRLSDEGRRGFEMFLADDFEIYAEAQAMRLRLAETFGADAR